MKKGAKIQTAVLLVCLFLPCVIVLFLGLEGQNDKHIYNNDYTVFVGKEAVDSEKFLIWALAAYAEPENEIESLKAIAVVLRTNLRKAMSGRNKISAEELPSADFCIKNNKIRSANGRFLPTQPAVCGFLFRNTVK